MEILFRDDSYYYFMLNDNLVVDKIMHHNSDVFRNVKHLDDIGILYHLKNKQDGFLYPVYYEHNDSYVVLNNNTYIRVDNNVLKFYTKDYTLVNLKLI